MFTRCPECETVFELEIEDLKAAEGKVCCGECDRVFNALVSLTDAVPTQPPAPAPAPAPEPEQDHDGDPQAPDDAAPTESSQDDRGEGGEPADAAIEGPTERSFWLPDTDTPETDEQTEDETGQWEQKLAELGLGGPDTDASQDASSGAAPGAGDSPGTGDSHSIEDEIDQNSDEALDHAGGPNVASDFPLAARLTSDDDAGQDDMGDPADWLNTPTPARANWPWSTAALLASLVLLVQVVHYWRESLAQWPVFQPWLGATYAALNMPLQEHWDIRAYQVEKGAVSDHPDMAGTLLVNAIIENSSPQPQPRPLLKVTLLDRWGEAIGERYFAATEYLPSEVTNAERMTSGERLEASVLIVDPGEGAVSYGIDVCLRDARNQLSCAHGNGL